MATQSQDGPESSKPPSPLREITQPFIDLVHAPRALWGINLAYVIEGMCYFGMLGYLVIYCSEFMFQAIDGADEAAHYMVMVLTAGITIAMFFLGVVADKRGVRFALIAAFLFMLAGRALWSGAPNLLGLEPVRPSVLAGDRVTLHVTELDTLYGNKTIVHATILANQPDAVDIDRDITIDLADGPGITPSETLGSKLVRLGQAEIVSGEDEEWTVRYGSEAVTATLFIRGAHNLQLRPGAEISLDHAYVARRDEEKHPTSNKKPTLAPGATISITRAQVIKQESGDDEYAIEVKWPDGISTVDLSGCMPKYVIRSHWVSDVAAVNNFPIDLAGGEGTKPGPDIDSWEVQLSKATLKGRSGGAWLIECGGKPIEARLMLSGNTTGTIDDSLRPDLAVGQGTPLKAEHRNQVVQIGKGKLASRDDQDWLIEYGSKPMTARLEIRSAKDATLGVGALVSLRRAKVCQRGGGDLVLQATWPGDFGAIDTYGCEESPYCRLVTTDERDLKIEQRTAVPDNLRAPSDAKPVTIASLRELDDGPVNAVLKDVNVTYVRNGGYMLQEHRDGPGIAVLVNPIGSPLQVVTIIGMLLVVIGYGMYQPAAYAGVRRFTTPKTAAMGFAMLYALMNLGGWLPTFAFLLRDDDYLGLGIPGVFWVYTGFTVIALVSTIFILSRRTVAEAEASAKMETARIKAERAAEQSPSASPEKDQGAASADEPTRHPRVKPHMWLFWVAAIVLFLFKNESPWYYGLSELGKEWSASGFASLVVWRWILAVAVFVSPAIIAVWPSARRWIAKHPLEDTKFAYFIFALIPVQTLFTYNWLVLPAYIKRAYEGWIGNYFEIASNSNPILVFIAVPIITAITQKRKVYNMMITGTFVMAGPAFLLVLGPHWWTLFPYILIMTIGEAMWQPRFLQYAAEIAPEGRTGEYMGVAQFPWFLTKVLVPLLYSGHMMDRFCPAEGTKNTEAMWLIFACIAMMSTVLLILAKGWLGKDFKTKAD